MLLLSPLRPVLHSGYPLRKFLGNVFTDVGDRALQQCIVHRLEYFDTGLERLYLEGQQADGGLNETHTEEDNPIRRTSQSK